MFFNMELDRNYKIDFVKERTVENNFEYNIIMVLIVFEWN